MQVSFSPELSKVMADLRPKLRQYLELKGVHFNSQHKFNCINPEHKDEHPSSSIVINNPEVYHCFSCGVSGNILTAAKIFDKLPMSGPAFIFTTLKSLCATLDVPFPDIDLTAEQKEMIDMYRAYELAGEYIANSTINKPSDYIKSRGWKPEVGFKYGIGLIESFNAFLQEMKNNGYNEAFLEKIGLINSHQTKTIYGSPIFTPNRIVFNIYDHHGNVVGFAGRRLDDNQENGDKYINTKETQLYHKRELLYGLNFARKSAVKNGLILVEGYADWITLNEIGINNCAAVCGSALTKEQIQLILSLGISQIFIAMDGDIPGRVATTKIVDQIMIEAPSLSVNIIQVPDNMDPDSYIQNLPEEYRLESWKALPQETCFSWQINKLPDNLGAVEVADKMLPMVLSEKHAVKQEIMLKELAEKTNITFDTLKKQLEAMAQTEEMKVSERKNAIVNNMNRELKRFPTNAKEIIGTHYAMLEEFESSSVSNNMDSTQTIKEFRECIDQWKNSKSNIFGIQTNFPELDRAIDGIQPGHTIGIGGKANQGKSSFMLSIAHNIIMHNPEVLVIIHSIDDPQKDVYSRLIAMNQDLVINEVKKPTIAFKLDQPVTIDGKTVTYDMSKVEKWKIGKSNIEEWIEKERLVIKDNTHGSSFGYTEGLVKFYRKKYPNRNIVLIFDNFHKASDYGELGDERLKYKALSNRAKLLSEKQNVASICSLEYTKADMGAGRKPTNNAFAETASIQYDFTCLFHLYNELKDIGDKATLIQNINGKKYPIIELNIAKNKQNDFDGKLYFYFTPEKALIKPCPAETILRQIKDSNLRSQSTDNRYGNLS